jgi:hypothetical protein
MPCFGIVQVAKPSRSLYDFVEYGYKISTNIQGMDTRVLQTLKVLQLALCQNI